MLVRVDCKLWLCWTVELNSVKLFLGPSRMQHDKLRYLVDAAGSAMERVARVRFPIGRGPLIFRLGFEPPRKRPTMPQNRACQTGSTHPGWKAEGSRAFQKI